MIACRSASASAFEQMRPDARQMQRGGQRPRRGTNMVTPPKIPANDGRPVARRARSSCGPACSRRSAWSLLVAARWMSGAADQRAKRRSRSRSLTSAKCRRTLPAAVRRTRRNISATTPSAAAGTCGAPAATWRSRRIPRTRDFKVAVARDLPYEQKAEAIAMLREAAAQGNAEAYYEIYEHHKSWDRGDLDKMQLVTRAEADRALHKAAELGHPFADADAGRAARGRRHREARYRRRAILGGTCRRQPCKGREQGRPAGDCSDACWRRRTSRTSAARGLEILERLSAPGHYQFGAKTELALAIRKEDPVRARTLLEESRRPDPGGAIVAARGNADRGRRRPGRPQARVVAC